MAVISADVFQVRDVRGNVRTEAWILFEYTGSSYSAGGEIIDLSPYFRRVEHVHATITSGEIEYIPEANAGDFPAAGLATASGRMQLRWSGGSGLEMLEINDAVAVSGARALVHVLGY